MPTPTVTPWPIGRQLMLMAALGTLAPLAVLAMIYALAPLPMTPQVAATLRAAVGMAGVFIGLNAAAVAVIAGLHALLARRRTGPARSSAVGLAPLAAPQQRP